MVLSKNVNKCSKCKVYPYDQVKNVRCGSKIKVLNMMFCTSCDKNSLIFTEPQKTIENWNKIN